MCVRSVGGVQLQDLFGRELLALRVRQQDLLAALQHSTAQAQDTCREANIQEDVRHLHHWLLILNKHC